MSKVTSDTWNAHSWPFAVLHSQFYLLYVSACSHGDGSVSLYYWCRGSSCSWTHWQQHTRTLLCLYLLDRSFVDQSPSWLMLFLFHSFVSSSANAHMLKYLSCLTWAQDGVLNVFQAQVERTLVSKRLCRCPDSWDAGMVFDVAFQETHQPVGVRVSELFELNVHIESLRAGRQRLGTALTRSHIKHVTLSLPWKCYRLFAVWKEISVVLP